MKRLLRDLKKYRWYLLYSAKSELRAEVAGSYLNWLWWILDPLLFMLVYTFVVRVVFTAKEQYFAAFVLIGLTAWNFFNKSVQGSVNVIRKNKSVVSKIYLPKYLLVLTNMMVLAFKMAISFVLIFVLMLILRVPFTGYILHAVPVLLVLLVVTFGISTIFMHFGVFVRDLYNVTVLLLRLVFYMTGVFYSIPLRVPAPYGAILLRINPLAFLTESLRGALLYGAAPDYLLLGVWFVIGLALSAIGITTVYRYENSYAKVI
ncbi:MAG: ABC transporter permease [Clostridiaceae bacterium]|nr:ABC transporter permease [Clostridiaceae bacterium]